MFFFILFCLVVLLFFNFWFKKGLVLVCFFVWLVVKLFFFLSIFVIFFVGVVIVFESFLGELRFGGDFDWLFVEFFWKVLCFFVVDLMMYCEWCWILLVIVVLCLVKNWNIFLLVVVCLFRERKSEFFRSLKESLLFI